VYSKGEDMKRFQIMLPEPMMVEMKKIAKVKGIAVSEVIRRSVDEWLKNNGHIYNPK
jgi:hypothetical protein